MTVRNICVYPDPILREPTEEITSFDEVLADLVEDMWETMHVSDGVGLAGPQVGMPKKIAVIEYNGEKFVLINPVIVEKEGSKTVEEGCLSFPGIYEKVDSPEKIKVRWQNEKGGYEEKEIDGFLACVFSHEIDHLNGKLFIDFLGPLKRQMITRKMEKLKRERARSDMV